MIRLSHPTFDLKNFEQAIGVLLDNGYPLKFVFKILHERLKTLFNNFNSNYEKHTDKSARVSYFTIPYVPSISERFETLLRT